VLHLVSKYKVQIEGNFATLCVATAVLEGIGRQLDPEINILGEAVPYFEKSPLRDTQKEVLEESSNVRRIDLFVAWVKAKFEPLFS
jgi:predicted unusual protein kinase regulating ubiquinone biosynthesis (AarF/ABC1/UbiB family)